MTAPMPPERLAEIRRLLGWADIAYERTAGHPPPDHIDHELLAEVDRLIEALEGAVKLAETLNTEVSRLTERCAALEAREVRAGHEFSGWLSWSGDPEVAATTHAACTCSWQGLGFDVESKAVAAHAVHVDAEVARALETEHR